MARYKKLGVQDFALIRQKSRSHTQREIASELGCGVGSVKRIQDAYELPRLYVKRRWSAEDDETLIMLYESRIPIADIASRLQRSSTSIVVHIEKLRRKGRNIQSRPKTGRPKKYGKS